jgi:hypothetical protein
MPQIQDAIVGKVTKKRDVDLNNMYQLPYDFGNSFYSYSNGMVHSIVLNSFADFEPGSNQYNWLVDEIQKVDRKIYPWLIVLVCFFLIHKILLASLLPYSHEKFCRSIVQFIIHSHCIRMTFNQPI